MQTSTVDVEAEADFGDVLENLEGAIMLRGEFWKGEEYGLITELNWIRVGAETEGPGPGLEWQQDNLILETTFASRMVTGEVDVDLLLGLRLIDNQVRLDLGGGGEDERHQTYLDPIMGARATWDLGETWDAGLRIDVGGFGIGTEIEGNTELFARCALGESFSMTAGYRALSMRIENDGRELQSTFHGPLFSFVFGF